MFRNMTIVVVLILGVASNIACWHAADQEGISLFSMDPSRQWHLAGAIMEHTPYVYFVFFPIMLVFIIINLWRQPK